jgi:hypothetical protein
LGTVDVVDVPEAGSQDGRPVGVETQPAGRRNVRVWVGLPAKEADGSGFDDAPLAGWSGRVIHAEPQERHLADVFTDATLVGVLPQSYVLGRRGATTPSPKKSVGIAVPTQETDAYMKSKNGSSMIAAAGVAPAHGAAMLGETTPKGGPGAGMESVGADAHNPWRAVSSVLSGFEEEVHPMLRPSHATVAVSKSARLASTHPEQVEQLVEALKLIGHEWVFYRTSLEPR